MPGFNDYFPEATPPMNRTFVQIPVAATAVSAAVAACAAVGVVFMVPHPAWRELSGVIVPVVALVFTAILLSVAKGLLERGTEYGRAAAQVDETTGLPSKRIAEHVLAAEFNAGERGRDFAIVLFRIEKFARFRVKHGPDAAERLMILVGRVFKRRTRGMHLSTRVDDNGTFLTVLSGHNAGGARIFAQRVLKDLSALEVADETQAVSAGVAVFESNMKSPNQLLAAAQAALAQAEKTGGTIVAAGEAEPVVAVR